MLLPLVLASLQAAVPQITIGVAGPQGDTLGPPRRAHHGMIYDEAGRRVLLTGGSTPLEGGRRFEFFNDLWAFDGTRWTPLAPSGGKWSGSGLAYDTRQKRVLAYGGYDGRGSLSALRFLEGDTWRTLAPHPELAAAEPGFVYDIRRDRFVAFGGSAGRGQANGDTWEFDGSAWSRVATAFPPARQAHAMVYDEARGRTFLFGGMGQGPQGERPPALGDTWEFDGRAWTAHHPAVGPSPRSGAGVAYDARRSRVILFGGVDSGGFKGDTWAWDGAKWQKLSDTGPEPRAMGYLAYDRQRDRIVLFGGRKGWPDGDLTDTWEWDGTSWRRFSE